RRTAAVALAAGLVLVAALTVGGWKALTSKAGAHAGRTGHTAGTTATPAPREMTLSAGSGGIWDVAFAPDGRSLASAGEDGTIRLWDVTTGRQTATLMNEPGHDKFHVVFSPDRTTLATDGERTDEIRLWDLATHDVIATLTDPDEASVDSLAFSPDGATLAVGASTMPTIGDPGRQLVRLWDVRTRRVIATRSGMKKVVGAVAFSPDGTAVAARGGDDMKTVRLWNADRGDVRTSFTGHTDAVYPVAFSPDGRMLASGATDHTIRLWKVS
ncbi:WD40 repeat domain-containing protein, partial [Actinoallomurus acaciae]